MFLTQIDVGNMIFVSKTARMKSEKSIFDAQGPILLHFLIFFQFTTTTETP